VVPSIIKTVTWDCRDALVLARFWAAALGSDVDEDSTSAKAFVEAAGWGAPNMWFNQVPEPACAIPRATSSASSRARRPDQPRS
jgi:hypothetical protein